MTLRFVLKYFIRDFPGGPVVGSQPASVAFDSCSGKMRHAPGKLSMCTTTPEPTCCNTEACMPRAHVLQQEKPLQ